MAMGGAAPGSRNLPSAVDGTVARDALLYDLFAVAQHSGSMAGGHYTAVAKHRTKHEWYSFNDSYVSQVCVVVLSVGFCCTQWLFLSCGTSNLLTCVACASRFPSLKSSDVSCLRPHTCSSTSAAAPSHRQCAVCLRATHMYGVVMGQCACGSSPKLLSSSQILCVAPFYTTLHTRTHTHTRARARSAHATTPHHTTTPHTQAVQPS